MASAAAADFPRSPDGPSFLVFAKEPGPYLHQELLDFSKRTSRPEEFPGLHPGPISPDEPFTILGNIDVDKSRRPAGDLIPCAMCTPNRFLSGKFIYVSRLQCVTIIGHCCAAKEALASAIQIFDAKQQKLHEENFLLAAAPHVMAKLKILEMAGPLVTEARRLHRALHKNAPHIQAYLRNLKRQDGALDVHIQLPPDDQDGEDQNKPERFRVERVGTIHGFTAALGEYAPDRELKQIEDVLSQIRLPTDQEEQFFLIANWSDEDRAKHVTLLRNVDSSYSKFLKRITDFVSFFEADNIAVFNKWGQHADNHLNIHARYDQPYGLPAGTKRLIIGTPQRQAVMMVSRALWTVLPRWEYVSFG